ncbi:MAG TPA: MBL fold metallo-hydrolase [Mycobacteriales bacterium]
MELTVLGCAGTFAGPTGGCSSYLVEHDGFRLMVDCGYAAVGALQRHGDLLDLDAVLVTHLHADHCIDLVAYSYARFYEPRGRPPALPVYGPAGTAERIAQAAQTSRPGWLDKVYDWQVLDGSPLRIGPFAVTMTRTNHPVECYALRLEAGGRSLVYSADTGACEDLVALATGADLFLCEASFVDGRGNPPDVHLCGREAGGYAARAGVGRLLLTHLVAAWGDEQTTLAEARAVFDGPLALARDGAAYTV